MTCRRPSGVEYEICVSRPLLPQPTKTTLVAESIERLNI